ncbi:hypothetical protein [Roseococcus suduntuyensis]|uniref:Sugar lactone lactonase YvrE n=1 Tax=Roseococcus suduntuyensis TaxID=455361 RepID=A0A840ADG0_9PROT|nr:hypothetical protein [Roseococcus suduntuyensis]MBB3899968.1 sugar lactone lactonase YvrE [Roseococcus suduntuyensis]
MTDHTTLPPRGESAVFPLPPMTATGGPPELSGLVLSGDGRLTVAAHGVGLAVRLEAEDAAQLALMLWQLSGRLAAERTEAAERAGDALDAITASFSGGAGHA